MRTLIAILSLLILPSAAFAGRYVSLAPATTEILFALGAGTDVCGVSRYCNFPEEALSREVVGDFSQPNIEKIVSLKPDIVFCTGLEQSPSIVSLKKLGITVCVSDPKNLAELYLSILEIGALTGRQEAADKLQASMKEAVEQAKIKAAGQPNKPKVFFEIWHDPLMTAGKGSFIDELITIAGGINICGNTPRPYCRVSEEVVLLADPDFIFLLSPVKGDPVEKVRKRFCWQKLAAVRNNHVFNDINEDILQRPSPRLIEGLKQLQEKILK